MSHDEMEREKEYKLRDRIFASPSLLPGFEEPTAAAKEVPVRRAGSADVVVVDADGEIAIVECKRASNPECRREVIGQVFEYAAGLWKCKYEDFECILAARGTNLTEPFEANARWDKATFRSRVSQILKDGDFRLFIAVDEMTQTRKKRLHRTVTFLNSRMPQVEFLAVALPREGDPESPYGNDPEAIEPLRPRTERSKLLAQIEDNPDAEFVAEELFDWADTMEPRGVEVRCPTKNQCFIEVPGAGLDGKTAGLFKVRLPGEVRVSLRELRRHWDEERTSRFIRDLIRIDAKFNIDIKSKSERPVAPLESLAQEGKRDDFLALMKKALETLTS